MEKLLENQYICTNCGYNMIGFHPDKCPFCGASRDYFITAKEGTKKYRVEGTVVNDKITQLLSVPDLGYEHAAYRIETNGSIIWIDCPSSYNSDLKKRPNKIIFTHPHFLGASNLYREKFSTETWIHREDAKNPLAEKFVFDNEFDENFTEAGIKAFHVNGHTPGFTIYIFEDALFICDYVFTGKSAFKFNPFGPTNKTHQQALKIKGIIEKRNLSFVCGQNYFMEYSVWKKRFDELIARTVNP